MKQFELGILCRGVRVWWDLKELDKFSIPVLLLLPLDSLSFFFRSEFLFSFLCFPSPVTSPLSLYFAASPAEAPVDAAVTIY